MTGLSERPLVSIVTPVLNRAHMIRACLASVARQDYPSIEHIVVDGGSSDGTLDIIQTFRSDHSLRWLSGHDEGMYDAINKGLREAQGEIVSYLNSDDLYLPWSVGVGVARLREGADLVYGDLAVLRRAPEASGLSVSFYPDFDIRYYTHVGTIGQPTVFWRRSLIREIGDFDSSYRLIGDCEYWLRAGVAGAKMEHVDEVLAVQIEHAGTLRATERDRLRQEFGRLRSHYSAFSNPPAWPRFQRLKKSIVWRKRLLEFHRAVRRNHPDRWPRFAGFLRRGSILADELALLTMMLPNRLRPPRAGWGDPAEFERELMEEIGIHDGRT